MTSSSDIKLQIKEISKIFNNKIVLDNISFNVFNGEFLSVLGPSGCGKTSLLRIIIGLLEPTSGQVIKDGIDITSYPSSKRKMGIVFQDYALFENLTVLQNIEYAMKFNKELKNTARITALDIIERVNLTEHINKKPYTLSGGQQQRVAIARTLALKPEIILFDEPMSALDVATRLSLRQEIKQLQKELGTTMIYITHDQEEAFALADRVMVMGDSTIHQLDTPINIISNPADNYVSDFVVHNLEIKINSLSKFFQKNREKVNND